jgi:PAS domain-containing protein
VSVFLEGQGILVYLGCNTAFARDAGFAGPKDIIGKNDNQMVWREQAEAYRRDDRQVIESGQSKLLIEESQTTPEGKTITVLASKLPLRDAKGEDHRHARNVYGHHRAQAGGRIATGWPWPLSRPPRPS